MVVPASVGKPVSPVNSFPPLEPSHRHISASLFAVAFPTCRDQNRHLTPGYRASSDKSQRVGFFFDFGRAHFPVGIFLLLPSCAVNIHPELIERCAVWPVEVAISWAISVHTTCGHATCSLTSLTRGSTQIASSPDHARCGWARAVPGWGT